MLQPMRLFRTALLAAAGSAAYAVLESQLPRIQEHDVPVRPGAPALTLLHLSDAHLRAKDRRRRAFLERLPDAIPVPDLILMTGDMIEDDSGIEPVLELLSRMPARYARAFIFGSHDYYQAVPRLPFKYLLSKDEPKFDAPFADTEGFRDGLVAQGWLDLNNRTEIVDSPHGRIRLAGVDDPYLRKHSLDHIERGEEALAIGLMHAPDVVSDFALHGFDVLVAGHTHAGQLRAPFIGALVTNSKLPNALASGVNRIGTTSLHVTPGLGTSAYMQFRFLARPEVTILRLDPTTP
jgi:predicted MPP superfamily phosphohydrolase